MDKFQAVIKDIKERSAKGQPVLVGTISIEKNEVLAELMEREACGRRCSTPRISERSGNHRPGRTQGRRDPGD